MYVLWILCTVSLVVMSLDPSVLKIIIPYKEKNGSLLKLKLKISVNNNLQISHAQIHMYKYKVLPRSTCMTSRMLDHMTIMWQNSRPCALKLLHDGSQCWREERLWPSVYGATSWWPPLSDLPSEGNLYWSCLFGRDFGVRNSEFLICRGHYV